VLLMRFFEWTQFFSYRSLYRLAMSSGFDAGFLELKDVQDISGRPHALIYED
jgi:hypothetical protein